MVRWKGFAVAAGVLSLLGFAACGNDSEVEATPTATATATATPTVTEPIPTAVATPTATVSPEEEVLAAYTTYWEVYAQALRDQDASRLDEVMTGPRLERGRAEIADLLAESRAVEQIVALNPVVLQVADDQAVVFDEYENRSYYVDPTTFQPLRPTPSAPEVLRDTITMHRESGTWKVFDGIREEPQQ